MPAPLIGSWDIEVRAVRPFTIHGDLYFELHVTAIADADDSAVIRLPRHAVAKEPTVGQQLSIQFLLGQVTAASVLET